MGATRYYEIGSPAAPHIGWTLDGTNLAFTIDYEPDSGSVAAYINGLFTPSTVVSTTVTLTVAPEASDTLTITYTVAAHVGAYTPYATVVGLCNRALLMLGANMLTTYNDNTPNGKKVRAVWPYVRDEVLQAKDWRCLKTRATLEVSDTEPEYGYAFAYLLPIDFLRLARDHYPQNISLNPVAYPANYWYQFVDSTGYPRYIYRDAAVYPAGSPFVVEVLPASGILCILTDYDNTNEDLKINYIRRETDPTVYSPALITAIVKRLAWELAISISESRVKSKDMEMEYVRALNAAEEVNQSMDSIEDEAGSQSWENAGR